MVRLSGKQNCVFFTQSLATLGTLMIMIQSGIMAGWTSPNVARLTKENSTISLTLSEASWVASCLNLGRFASVILVPVLIELAGSKKTIFYSFLPTAVSWALMLIADSAVWLYIARFLGGITFGMAYGCFSIYLGEVAVPAYRGSLISLAMSGGLLGNVVGTTGATYLPMNISSAIYLVMSLASMSLFMWLPESPFHLVKKKQMDEARKSLLRYRGQNAVDKELEEIVNFVESNSKQTFSGKILQLRSTAIRKALFLTIVLFSFVQLCGLFNILFYMEIILTKAKSFLIDPREFVIYANIVAFFSTLVAVQLIDRFGRRILLLISGIGVTTAMIILGLHFYLLYDVKVDQENIQWLPIFSVILFVITFTMGFMPVPSTILSEIFSSDIKSAAACVASLTSAFLGFVSSKSYQPMVDAIGEAYVFWIHAGFSVLAVPVALFWLPETKGKSFQEIQNILRAK